MNEQLRAIITYAHYNLTIFGDKRIRHEQYNHDVLRMLTKFIGEENTAPLKLDNAQRSVVETINALWDESPPPPYHGYRSSQYIALQTERKFKTPDVSAWVCGLTTPQGRLPDTYILYGAAERQAAYPLFLLAFSSRPTDADAVALSKNGSVITLAGNGDRLITVKDDITRQFHYLGTSEGRPGIKHIYGHNARMVAASSKVEVPAHNTVFQH